MGKRQIDVYIDESGNFAPFTKQNPVYSVAFVFVERNEEVKTRSGGYLRGLSALPGGDHFVHVGNLVRGKAPYEYLSREQRQKLFYGLFMFAKRLEMKFYSFHAFKSASSQSIFDLSGKISRGIGEMLAAKRRFFEGFDKVVVHYDNGQLELGLVLQSSFMSGLPCEVEFVETRQMEEPIMQVADMICYLETLYFKLKEGHPTNSDLAFFGPTKGDIDKKYLNPLRKKQL